MTGPARGQPPAVAERAQLEDALDSHHPPMGQRGIWHRSYTRPTVTREDHRLMLRNQA